MLENQGIASIKTKAFRLPFMFPFSIVFFAYVQSTLFPLCSLVPMFVGLASV